MDVSGFYVRPVSHFVKVAGQKFFILFFKISFSIFKCVSPKKKLKNKNFLSIMNFHVKNFFFSNTSRFTY